MDVKDTVAETNHCWPTIWPSTRITPRTVSEDGTMYPEAVTIATQPSGTSIQATVPGHFDEVDGRGRGRADQRSPD